MAKGEPPHALRRAHGSQMTAEAENPGPLVRAQRVVDEEPRNAGLRLEELQHEQSAEFIRRPTGAGEEAVERGVVPVSCDAASYQRLRHGVQVSSRPQPANSTTKRRDVDSVQSDRTSGSDSTTA
jgi:hypothetical protein